MQRDSVSASLQVLLLVAVATAARPVLAAPPPGYHPEAPAVGVSAGAAWFHAGIPPAIRIEISAEARQSLRRDPRGYVRAMVTDGRRTFRNVALRVKGRTGSFRTIDEKPSLTLDLAQFAPGQNLDGTTKVHLNNSVEDPGYLQEKLGSAVYHATGLPAPLVAHAVVTLNGRRLGLYVVREGFTPEFLARHFQDATGNFYEPEPGTGLDVGEPMKRNFGSGPTNWADLRVLAEAARETDLSRRQTRMEESLAYDRFLRFLTLEVLLAHRDGYGVARNNYRLYANPADHRFVFLPSGMDRLLPRAEASLFPNFSGAIARAIVETPAGRAAYWETMGLVFTNVFLNPVWTNRIRMWADAISPALTRREKAEFLRESKDLTRRWNERLAFVGRQLAAPAPRPIAFASGQARLTGWQPRDVPEGGSLDEILLDGRRSLRVQAGPKTSASWRTTVWLDTGQYRFEARIRGQGIRPLPFGRNHGATLAVDNRTPSAVPRVIGDMDWTLLNVEFEVREGLKEVELSCVLRASAGQAWVDAESLKLVRTDEPAPNPVVPNRAR